MNTKTSPHDLGQYFTPFWACEALVQRYLPDIGRGDTVLEPTCGEGSFLAAIPSHVHAVGVEIDPAVAARAAHATGRPVVCGDFRTVELQVEPTAVIGNPPFRASVFDAILDRAHAMLPVGAPAGFILPTYILQTPSRVERYARHWSLSVDLLPRTLFPRLSKPLVFVMFRKGASRALVGFALMQEARSIESVRPEYQALLRKVSGSAWATAAVEALANLGGEADLETIYSTMSTRRPTANVWWKDRIRAVLQSWPFERVGPARYALRADHLREFSLAA